MSKKIDIIPAIMTDHSALLMKFDTMQTLQRGRGYWKFNNSLLSNSSFVELMQKKIKSKMESYLKYLVTQELDENI